MMRLKSAFENIRLTVGCVLAACSLMLAVPAQAQDFGACDARMFLSQAIDPSVDPSTLYDIDTSTNPFTFPPIGTDGTSVYNAMGFNPNDFFIYAMLGTTNELLQIGTNGIPVNLGPVTGLPVPTGSYLAGAFDGAGVYYVKISNQNRMYAIDVGTLTATTIVFANPIPGNTLDLAWHSGQFYTAAGDQNLYTISTTGTVTLIGPTGQPPGTAIGAMFGGPSGIFGNANDGTGFYRFDDATGDAALISQSPGAQSNDGAHCPNAAIQFDADLAVTKTDGSSTYAPGAPVVYTIVVTNNGPFGVQNALVSDPLPAGITDAAWTCVASVGGRCNAATGTGMINTLVSLQDGATATFTLTLQVPPDFTGDLINTVTVSPPPLGSNDPTPGNNVASDTSGEAAAADLSITKTNTPDAGPSDQPGDTLAPGESTTYTIVVTNNGPSTVTGAVVEDPTPPAPLVCPADNAATCTSAASPSACPGNTPLTIGDLQAGVTLGTLPPTTGVNQVTFEFTCEIPE